MRKYKYPLIAACLLLFNLILVPQTNAANTNTFLHKVKNTTAKRDDAPIYDILPVEEELRKRLKGYIAKDNIKKLLQMLLVKIQSDSVIYNEVCLFSFRFNDLEDNIRRGLIPVENAAIFANHIALGLLTLIDEIPVIEILQIVAP